MWATVMQEAGTVEAPYPKHNPLTKTGKKVKRSIKKQYGERGEEVFYKTMNKKKMGKKWHR